MFSEKEKSVNTNVHVFHKLLEAANQGVLLKPILKKFVKFTRKLSCGVLYCGALVLT